MSVRLPRGSGFCVGNVVRESKTRTKVTMKERGGERGKDCDWDAWVVLCHELEGSFVVEQEAMVRTRDNKKRKKRKEKTEINRVT